MSLLVPSANFIKHTRLRDFLHLFLFFLGIASGVKLGFKAMGIETKNTHNTNFNCFKNEVRGLQIEKQKSRKLKGHSKKCQKAKIHRRQHKESKPTTSHTKQQTANDSDVCIFVIYL